MMLSHEEDGGETGHSGGFCGASCSACETGELLSDVGVEALELLGEAFAGEMGSQRQDGCVSSEIVGESEPPPGLRKGGWKLLQILGSSPADMDAAEASGEEALRNPEPDLFFSPPRNARPRRSWPRAAAVQACVRVRRLRQKPGST